ncbi:hypothetical protein [Cellulosimicrobium funkei]|nr:hypothetical protein [Cellulosimicrobium funkei]
MKHNDAQVDLPRVQIVYMPDWTPDVTVAGEPYDLPAAPVPINVRDPRDLGRLVALDLGQAVHVVAVNPEGAMYTQICEPEPFPTPTEVTPVSAPAARSQSASHAEFPLGVVGRGFLPGEQVCIAVVVAARNADDDGRAALPLPAPLLERLPSAVVLLGRTSGTVVVHHPAVDALAAGVA